jgi:uncharacterized membrane protein YcaP (DUF421 family)
MDFLWRIDWERLVMPQMSLLEILLRGSLVYLGLCLLLRVVLKRQAGKVSLSDLLVVTLVAGVCRNPLVKDDYSITDGILVIAIVLLWSYLLDWMSYRFTFVHGLFHPSPVPLIRDGHVLRDNLHGELMTEAQLQSKLRLNGVRTPDEVAEAWMEGDGHVSVIKKSESAKGSEVSPSEPCAGPSSAAPHTANNAEIEAFKQAALRLIDQATRLTVRG